jgi:para-aminobenzoate synthetase/4-amino-4-deoxychorismate lyase
LTLAEDRERRGSANRLEKNRAENVMIVDMVRNDIGRVSFAGSIDVPELFAIEKYPTVWQMTSTVRGRTHASVSEIFSALFPAASITGAPKSSAMRLIAELESGPRGFYTGRGSWLRNAPRPIPRRIPRW